MSQTKNNISILGCGNIGSAIAFGLIESESIKPKNITVTRRNNSHSSKFTNLGINFTTNNRDAVKNSDVIIIAVTPQQLKDLIEEIKDVIDSKRHYIFSVVSGATIKQIKNLFPNDIPVVRVMPNTAIAIRESMTCISGDASDKAAIEKANQMFGELGKCVIIQEELMIPATALCACGIAFFLRAIRAASQGAGLRLVFMLKRLCLWLHKRQRVQHQCWLIKIIIPRERLIKLLHHRVVRYPVLTKWNIPVLVHRLLKE